MDGPVREGDTPAEAMRKIKVAHGEAASPAFIMNAMGKHGVHPNLVNGPADQQAAAARCAPFLNAPHRGRGRGRQATLPTQRCIAPIFRGADVPRFDRTSVAVQGTLLAEINCVGNGDPAAIFQSTRVTANVQKTSMQNWWLANCMQKQQFLLFSPTCVFCICSAPLLLRSHENLAPI